jgi:hypothetical protein
MWHRWTPRSRPTKDFAQPVDDGPAEVLDSELVCDGSGFCHARLEATLAQVGPTTSLSDLAVRSECRPACEAVLVAAPPEGAVATSGRIVDTTA